jgi:hypothetical protein
MKGTENTKSFPFLDVREGWIVFILLGSALGVRLYMVFHTYLITNDAMLYIRMAKLISEGETSAAFGMLFFNLYPLLIAAFQKVFLDWELSGQLVSAVFGMLTLFPFYLLVRSLFGRSVAFISSILFVFHPYLVRFSAEVIRGPTFWFFFVTTLWVGWEAISRKRAWLFFLTSLLGGASFLLRPEGIFVVPIVAVWVLLDDLKTFKSTYRQRIVLALILLLTVPILVSPAMLYLKKKTGHWFLGRAEDIPRLAVFDITMEGIEKDFDRMELNPWDDSSEAQTDLIRLREFLSLAKEHRVGIVGLEFLRKFQKAMHPLLVFLLLFGVIMRRSIPYRKREELFLLSVLVILFFVVLRYGMATFYMGTRHMMAPVILCLAWVGVGVVEVEHRIRRTVLGPPSTVARRAISGSIGWILLILIVLSLLPKTLAPQRLDKVPMREAGVWIEEHGPTDPVVMTQAKLARLVFYANGTFVEIPRDRNLHEYARKQGVDFLAVNERDIERSHPGLIDSLDPQQFKKEVILGNPSGRYVIRIYSVKS